MERPVPDPVPAVRNPHAVGARDILGRRWADPAQLLEAPRGEDKLNGPRVGMARAWVFTEVQAAAVSEQGHGAPSRAVDIE